MQFPRRIAVFLPSWVGDAVMATPALRALRGRFPNAFILFVGKPAVLETLAGSGLSDGAAADLSASAPGLSSFLRTARELRRSRADTAVLLPNSFRSALLARCGGARRVIGYDRDGRGWLLTDRLRPARDDCGELRPVPAIDYYCDLVGVAGVEVRERHMSLSATPDGQDRADRLLSAPGFDPARPLVMLNPGAGFGPSKMWDGDRYAAVADALVERRGAQIIINCAPDERDVAAGVEACMKHRPLISFAREPNSLSLLKGLMRRCRLLITNDTGARHVAAAMGVAVVSIFGSTDPRWTGIRYDRERIVRADVPCSPCQSELCLQAAGPKYQQCTAAVTVAMVLSAAEELLAGPAVGGGEPGAAPALVAGARP